ncbi:MAG: DUF547 domain-containing protein [Candidatus Omnitrophica bacterium]|nr:DUF547 domain-containing protein [Candidatus Omnitrophota bacterium]
MRSSKKRYVLLLGSLIFLVHLNIFDSALFQEEVSPEFWGNNILSLKSAAKNFAYLCYASESVLSSENNQGGFSRNVLAFAFEADTVFDNALYRQLLSKYLDRECVDYKGIQKDPALLYAYLKQISSLHPELFAQFSAKEQMALYINAYNAFTIKAVVDHYPVVSVRKIPGIWDKIEFVFARKKITLDEIEDKIMRPELKDPRTRFALVCAAKGCPALNAEPFNADNLDIMLENSAINFLNDASKNLLDKQNNVLYLSAVFKWFKDDFGEVIPFISKYLPQEEVNFIRINKPAIKFQYDWNLNDKK